jgi:CBS domain-containing protein
MSSRAAWRLESLGFIEVYRYHEGKVDWLAAGLPTEGKQAHQKRVDDVAHRGVPTCHPGEHLGAVQALLKESSFNVCVVVSEPERVILGMVRGKALEADPFTLVEDVMNPAPVTYRPSVKLAEVAHNMNETGARTALVSTGEGVLVGLIRRDEVERLLNERRESA